MEPGWVPDADFDVANHVGRAPVAGAVDHTGLLELVARLFEQRLDRARPLWRMDVVALADGGSALVWRIHHALADGTASVRYARALLWDHEPDEAGDHPGAGRGRARRRRGAPACASRRLPAPRVRTRSAPLAV